MKKIFKNALSLTVAMSLAIGNTPLSYAISEDDTYVALGDSISTGHKLEDKNNLFVNKIEKTYNLDLTNLAKNGMDSTIMLNLLKSEGKDGITYRENIKNADLITISMGGNNLLQPLLGLIKEGLKLPSDADAKIIELAIKNNPNAFVEIFTDLKNNPENAQILKYNLEVFATEFPQIINTIKTLNPNTEIIIQTVYNPFNDAKEFLDLANIIDPFFQAMNKTISEGSVLGYEVVDVYADFKSNDSQVPLTNMEEFDVHPNKAGNEVIFNAHKKILDKEENEIEVKSLAGNDRYETAIKVSQERFNNGEANAVILVGKDAVVDGLAAAPLAMSENAPILFADVNYLNTETIAEMIRVLGPDFTQKTVYIIGGETRISAAVELMLGEKGIKVDRIHGQDRYETSLNVAKQLNSNSEVAFVVGGNGKADAMSISAKAAELKAPIVVVEKNKLSEEAKDLLKNKEIYIIGGDSCVSEEVKLELDKLDKNNSSERIAGINRKETNAKVIKEFYNPEEISEIFVAKDGFGRGQTDLVDALVGAPLVGSKSSLMVLSTNDLNELQKENLKVFNNINKVTVVGNGISENTMKTIVNLLNNK